MSAVISIRGLSHRYGATQALAGLDLEINAGGITGLVGPNGAGKTTLYSLLAGYYPVQQGEVQVMGQVPGSAALSGRYAILPQDAPLRRKVAVRRQLRYLAELQGMSAADARAETERVLTATGVADVADRSPEKLSHGLYKRVAIAQCLLGAPELVLLDEPTAGLDPVATHEIHGLIRSLGQASTVLLSSHNLSEIQDLCQSIILIDKGKLVRHTSLDELAERLQYLTLTLSETPPSDIDELLTGISGVIRVLPAKAGDPRVVIEFNADNPDAFQMEVLGALSERRIGVVNFSRGRDLADSVVEMMNRA